jgi:hypothetical protein
MAKLDAHVVLYVVDLDDLRGWIGCADQKRFDMAWEVIREDDEWDEDALEVLEDLLRRIIFQGKLYEGLDEGGRYLVTQILVDLFDEFADPDAISEDIPLDRFLQTIEGLPREVAPLGRYLARGRRLDGDGVLWEGGTDQFVSPYFGWVTRDEAAGFRDALKMAEQSQRTRPSGIQKQLRAAADECARAGLDLLAYVG